jgi:hypothetical protein
MKMKHFRLLADDSNVNSVHLSNTEPGAYEHFNKINKFNDIIHGKKNKFDLQIRFKEDIMFLGFVARVCWNISNLRRHPCRSVTLRM